MVEEDGERKSFAILLLLCLRFSWSRWFTMPNTCGNFFIKCILPARSNSSETQTFSMIVYQQDLTSQLKPLLREAVDNILPFVSWWH